MGERLEDFGLALFALTCGLAGLLAVADGHGVIALIFSLIGLAVLFFLRLIWFFEDTVGSYPYYALSDLYPVLERWIAEAADA